MTDAKDIPPAEAEGERDGESAAAAAAAVATPADPKSQSACQQREARVLRRLLDRFPVTEGVVVGEVTHGHKMFVTVREDAIEDVLRYLRDEPDLGYELFLDLTCADYLKLPELAPARFGLLYVLYSFEQDAYARIRVYIDADDVEVPTASSVFPGAGWAEREIYDLYGIRFAGHPDLQRILLPDGYRGHPLRKDYPLKGRGERDSFPVITRAES